MTQSQPRSQMQRAHPRPGWGWAIAAGTGAGVVAGLVSVGLEIMTGSGLPPRDATFWSAVAAGVLAGLLYGWLSRLMHRPIAWFWIITLGIATVDSLLIAFVPGPAGEGPKLPLVGLVAPLRQLAALLGVGRLGTQRYPAQDLGLVTAVHYVCAVVSCLLIPRWAKLSQTG